MATRAALSGAAPLGGLTQLRDTLVSVYLPTRNRSQLLQRAAASVLAQSHFSLELLIVDDGSTDDTPEVVAKLAASDSRVKAQRFDMSRGAPAARNAAIRAATGRWVTGIDDDDEMRPDRLKHLLAAHSEEHSFVCSAAILDTGKWRKPLRDSRAIITLDVELFGDQVGTQALVLKDRMLAVGGFDESLPAWQDYDLWVRLIARFGSALRLAEPSYVIHQSHESPRISQHGALGAQHFIEKHATLMNEAQLRSQGFELLALRGERLGLREAWELTHSRNALRPLRYWLTSNFPSLRKVAAAYRQLRH